MKSIQPKCCDSKNAPARRLARSTGVIALFLAALVLCSACGRVARRQLVAGMELAYPPFEMTDAQGSPAGVSVDLARDLGSFLHRDVEIQNIPFSGLIPALKTGKIDLIISSMTATPERAESISFSDPYLKTGLCLLVRRSSPVQTIADADRPGITLTVKQGTTGQNYAAHSIHQARVLVLDKETACVLEVAQGKADAFIYDQMSTFKNWQKNQDRTRAILTPFQTESWAIGIRKGNDELLNGVNDFLRSYKTNGGFDKLGDRYLSEQKAAFKELGIPFYF